MKKYFVTLSVGLSLLLCLFAQQSQGQFRLPNFFSDHMVLQRETEANIWGWGHAGSTIRIVGSWNLDTVTTTTDANGKWKATVKTGEAGGPYTVTFFAEGRRYRLNDVLLGDVYLCSGQSNMEWGGNQNLKEIHDELPYANNPSIRLLQINRNGANAPQENVPNVWDRLDDESLKPFSAIGYFIAKELNSEIGVPIGVINSSWGGTPAEVWTPKELVEGDAQLAEFAKIQPPADFRPHESGSLWNGMIAPLAGLNIKGFFWYQGESNIAAWPGYDSLMKVMVKSWRKAWGEQIPFYFVQIAPFTYNNQAPLAALLREQQAKTAIELDKVGMVVTTDLVSNVADIHPDQKQAVAERLARIALAEIYDKPSIDYKSPIYKDHQVKGNKIEISFHYLNGNLHIKGNDLTDIYISGEDKVFHPARAKVNNGKLIVYSSEVSNPVAVRFGFSETAMPNLFNDKGLPVSPFRTDTWTF